MYSRCVSSMFIGDTFVSNCSWNMVYSIILDQLVSNLLAIISKAQEARLNVHLVEY